MIVITKKPLNQNRMKTAVEWLVDKIAEDYPEIPKSYREECQKAKEMEKEQIKNAYYTGHDDVKDKPDR